MSRSVWRCRSCGQPLGHRHHGGRLHPVAGVLVYLDTRGRRGPHVRLVCPGCGNHRDYVDGSIVVRSQPLTAARESVEVTP